MSMAGRYLFCPICGQRVRVEFETPALPESHRLPDHFPLGNAHPDCGPANLCQGLVVTVTLDMDVCKECGARMSKHPSGMCRVCYGVAAASTAGG